MPKTPAVAQGYWEVVQVGDEVRLHDDAQLERHRHAAERLERLELRPPRSEFARASGHMGTAYNTGWAMALLGRVLTEGTGRMAGCGSWSSTCAAWA